VSFYLNAVDEQLRLGDDRESVGIILCAGGDATVAKLALHRDPVSITSGRPSLEARRQAAEPPRRWRLGSLYLLIES
jgi:hypothetical protein